MKALIEYLCNELLAPIFFILMIPFIIISLLLKGINKLLIWMDFKPIPIPKWLQFENNENKEKPTNLGGDEDGKQQ